MDRFGKMDPAFVAAAVYANSFRALKPSVVSTGFRTHALRHDARRHTIAPGAAEEFLVNSRLRRRDVELESSVGAYFTDSSVTLLSLLGNEGRRGARKYQLPRSVSLRMSLGDVLGQRRSIRTYTGEAMPFAYLATVVRAGTGITGHISDRAGDARIPVRSAPSAGGLYPVDLHVAVQKVEGLPNGLYWYSAREDVLWQTGDDADLRALHSSLAIPDQVISVRQAGAFCLLVARPWRSMRKYGARGMRNLFLEAGAMAQNLNLASVALGLGSVDCGSYYDDESHEALGIDGLYQALIHMVILGIPG